MDKTVQILAPGARNTDGTSAPASVFLTTWAAIRALTGQELYKAQLIVQQVTHLVTIPYQVGVAPGMSIGFGGRTFLIGAVQDPDERKIELRILAIERGQNAGQNG